MIVILLLLILLFLVGKALVGTTLSAIGVIIGVNIVLFVFLRKRKKPK